MQSDTLAANVNIEQLQAAILLNTTGEYMKESDTLADNATNISLARKMSQDTKDEFMKD